MANVNEQIVAAPLRNRAWNVVRIALGLLLLVAAGLKLAGQDVSAVPQVGWFATPTIQIAAAEWEIVLGIWLLSGAYRVGAWVTALGTSITFAAVSGYLAWIGVASCGCFGAIQASPWMAFGVDLAALLLLVLGRPSFEAWSTGSFRRGTVGGLKWVGLTALLLTGLGAASTYMAGSPEAALARLRGNVLTVSPDYIDLGSGSAHQTLVATVAVRNWSGEPVHLIGGTSDCSCVATSDLPLTVPPGEARALVIRLTIPSASKSGEFNRLAELWTDHASQPRIRLRIGCRVVN
jgi:hypothetical protein